MLKTMKLQKKNDLNEISIVVLPLKMLTHLLPHISNYILYLTF